ncbi:MAG: hypothetical protein IJ848_03725 [Alphaproteobacteria bacterium]|nr:hypothetical protein [Alphaproteobacteria bacterium]
MLLSNTNNINFEQLLNYYSNSMYDIGIKSIKVLLYDVSNNKQGILNTISDYIDVLTENISWLQEYVLPNLDIIDGKYNIKTKLTNNMIAALHFPINGLNKLQEHINDNKK